MAFFPPADPAAGLGAPAAADPRAARQQRRQDRRQASPGTPGGWQPGAPGSMPPSGGKPFQPPPGSGVSPFAPDGPPFDGRPMRPPPGGWQTGLTPATPGGGDPVRPGTEPGGGGPDPYGTIDPKLQRQLRRRYNARPRFGGDKPGGPPGMGGGVSPFPPSMQPPPFDPNAPTRS